MDVEIGSNLYRNTDGTVEVEGVPQMMLTLKKPEGPLLVNFVLFDEGGRVTAKVVDSTMAFNEKRAHELERGPAKLVIKHAETGTTVLHVEIKEAGRVVFKTGSFLTMKGHRFEITNEEWRVEKIKMSRSDSDVKGGAVVLG